MARKYVVPAQQNLKAVWIFYSEQNTRVAALLDADKNLLIGFSPSQPYHPLGGYEAVAKIAEADAGLTPGSEVWGFVCECLNDNVYRLAPVAEGCHAMTDKRKRRLFAAADLVHYAERGIEQRQWRVVAFLKRVEDPLNDPLRQINEIIKTMMKKAVARERRERQKQGLPANRRYSFRHCFAHEATHLQLSGLCGGIAPVEECEYIEQVAWPTELIQDAIDYADDLAREGERLIGTWRWE